MWQASKLQMVRKFAENAEIVKFSKIEGTHSTEKFGNNCNESKIEHFSPRLECQSSSAFSLIPGRETLITLTLFPSLWQFFINLYCPELTSCYRRSSSKWFGVVTSSVNGSALVFLYRWHNLNSEIAVRLFYFGLQSLYCWKPDEAELILNSPSTRREILFFLRPTMRHRIVLRSILYRNEKKKTVFLTRCCHLISSVVFISLFTIEIKSGVEFLEGVLSSASV